MVLDQYIPYESGWRFPLTLRTSVHDNLGHHASQEEPIQAQRESETSPIVSVFQHLEHITLNINTTVKVLLIESLKWNLATSAILRLVCIRVESEVVLDGQTRVRSLFILAGRKRRREGPVGCENGDGGEDGEEDAEFEATTDFPGEVERNQGDGREEEGIGESVIAGCISRKRCVFD